MTKRFDCFQICVRSWVYESTKRIWVQKATEFRRIRRWTAIERNLKTTKQTKKSTRSAQHLSNVFTSQKNSLWKYRKYLHGYSVPLQPCQSITQWRHSMERHWRHQREFQRSISLATCWRKLGYVFRKHSDTWLSMTGIKFFQILQKIVIENSFTWLVRR